MAAVIYQRKKIVSVGMNSRKTHPLQKRFQKNPHAHCKHAEIDALVNAMRLGVSVEGCSIAVARVNRKGEPRLAKPCKGCQKALIDFGISNVIWTTQTQSSKSDDQ